MNSATLITLWVDHAWAAMLHELHFVGHVLEATPGGTLDYSIICVSKQGGAVLSAIEQELFANRYFMPCYLTDLPTHWEFGGMQLSTQRMDIPIHKTTTAFIGDAPYWRYDTEGTPLW
jgi:hypothetical protein